MIGALARGLRRVFWRFPEVPTPQAPTTSPSAAPPAPPAPPAPDWSGAVKQLRDVSQWIIGGVVATAAGVFAGSTLTKIGSLGLPDDAARLGLALGGVFLGFIAIALILIRGIEVLAPVGNSLPLLAAAPEDDQLRRARDYLYKINGIDQGTYPLAMLLERSTTKAGIAYLPRLYAAAPFCVVRLRFNRLLRWMMACVPIAILGFGLFAWAANPPEPKPGKPPILTINAP